ncbi:hypothetical protein [Ligilactobacillus sp.]|uniref:hypothetical protein n=1 Tax=Ligilactobacillus sp. TaxID=2767921 RepID=UPI002FE33DDB
MGISLTGLSATDASIAKLPEKQESYRIDQTKVKESFKQGRTLSKDVVELSKEALTYKGNLNPDEIKNDSDVRKVSADHALDTFFREDMPGAASDGSYSIGGVSFGREELEKVRLVMNEATAGIGCGAGKNTYIDYRNYAQMSIAENAVGSYADASLNEQQAEVVKKAMSEYTRGLVSAQDDLMKDGSHVDSPYERFSDYYGKVYVLGDDDLKALDSLKQELSGITGRTYGKSEQGTVSVISSATNQKLINDVSSLFSNIDYTNQDEIDSAMEKYRSLMKPVYHAYYDGQDGSAKASGEIIDSDIREFMKQIETVRNASGYHTVDFQS